jgi:hypothetical protein
MKKLIIILAFILAFITILSVFTTASEDVFAYSLKSDGTYEVTKYKGSNQEQVNIPAVHLDRAVTSIGDNCFTEIVNQEVYYHPEVKRITIPYTITSIGDNAFTGTSWINDPENADDNGCIVINGMLIKYIGNSSVLTLPSTFKTINYRAFENNNTLSGIVIPTTVTSIKDNAFNGCTYLNTITIAESVTEIGKWAFRDTAFSSITLPSGVTTISQSMFSGCKKLRTVTLHGQISVIEKYAFLDCLMLENLIFSHTDAANIIPYSVTEIGYGAFYGCKSLKQLTLGENIKTVGDIAFADCTALNNIYVPETVGTNSIGSYSFGFSLIPSGNSFTPERINSLTIHVMGATKARYNTPIIKYCHSFSKYKFYNAIDYVVTINVLLGDANGDGKISTTDARRILRCALGLDIFDAETYDFDMNLDGEVKVADARLALRMAMNLVYYPEKLS